jgi:hypothetical protein
MSKLETAMKYKAVAGFANIIEPIHGVLDSTA